MKKCNLCLKEYKRLHQESHLIPKWAYKYTQPNNVLDGKLRAMRSNGKSTRAPQGLYDKDLFCEQCESILGKLDSVGKDFFVDAHLAPQTTEIPDITYLSANFDKFIELRKFILSVCFRIGLSGRKELDTLNLDKKIIKKFRKELLSKGIDNNKIFITKSKSKYSKKYEENMLLLPRVIKVESNSYIDINFTRGLSTKVKIGKSKDETLDKLNINGNRINIIYTSFENDGRVISMLKRDKNEI